MSGLLTNLGISAESASLLISALTTFLMLPCILVSMRLMDVAGRRQVLFCFTFVSLFFFQLNGNRCDKSNNTKAVIAGL